MSSAIRWRSGGWAAGSSTAPAGARLRRRRRCFPRWRRGLEAGVPTVMCDMVWMGLFTGLRVSEVSGLRWEDIDASLGWLRIRETKSGRALELPVTRQVRRVLERRREARGADGGWVFAAPGERGPYKRAGDWYARDQRKRGFEVLVSRLPQCFHHGGGARPEDGREPGQAAGQPCAVARRDGRIRGGVDARRASRGVAAHRRSGRGTRDGRAARASRGAGAMRRTRCVMSARGKRVAARKVALTGEEVTRAEPRSAPYVIWDDRLTGFGVRVSPGGTKSFFLQFRTGEGRRTDRNQKLTLGRYPGLSPGAARKQAQALLGRARDGRDPSRERALARRIPHVGEAVEAWLETRHVADASLRFYRRSADVWLNGWTGRRLDEVTREDIAGRFSEVTERHGRVKANLGLWILGAAYRRCAVDYPGLRNPVERWKHAGGRVHRLKRRRIEHPAALLPAWDRGIRGGVRRPGGSRLLPLWALYRDAPGRGIGASLGTGWRSRRGGSRWTRPRAGSVWSCRSLTSSRRSSHGVGRHGRAGLGGCSLRRPIPSSRSAAPTATIAPSSAMAASRAGTTRFATASSRSRHMS